MSRAFFVAVAAITAPAFAEGRFFSAIEDLPLAPGLEETSVDYAFAGEEGRIIGAEAQGSGSPEAVRAFYRETLPALGWSQSPGAGSDGELVFQRGRERLSLTIDEAEAGAQVGVRLSVRPSPGD